jgi:hypothetical protein
MGNVEIESSCGDVSGDEHIAVFGLLELVEFLEALFLLHVRVEVEGGDGEGVDEELHPPAALDGVGEDDGLGV